MLALARKIYGEIDRFDWIDNLYKLKAIKAAILSMEAAGPYKGRRDSGQAGMTRMEGPF